MTILPKKKEKNQKSDGEGDSQQRGSSPLRRNPSTSTSHEDLDSTAGEFQCPHKRRHRSSPHRVRKLRHDRSATSSSSPQTSTSTSEQEDSDSISNIDEAEKWFVDKLKKKHGFDIKEMGQDGACLFRAVADQVFGDQEMHGVVRKNCIDYMAKNAEFFSQYVVGDFKEYLVKKSIPTCHGDNVEIQAIAEMYNRPIEVYRYSEDPINTFHATYKTENEPIRISYHRDCHYNSIVHPYKASIGVGLGLPNFEPGLADKKLLKDAIEKSERLQLEEAMLADKTKETDWEMTQGMLEEHVARESYLQWVREQEQHSTPRPMPTATATAPPDSNFPQAGCSSALTPPPSDRDKSPEPEGAVGGVIDLPPELYGLATYEDEDVILARVMAQSEQEYFDNLRYQNENDSSSNMMNEDS